MKYARLLSALLLAAAFLAPAAHAQYTPVNCAPATPCNSSTGPANTGTGDPAWKSFGKVNANFALIPTQLFSGTALPIANGGTGATTLAAATIPLFSGAITAGHCVEWLSSTVIEDAGAACGSGGGGTFNSITTGTNTATLTMGTGGTLTFSGTGIVNADQINGAIVPASAAILASNSSSQATALTLGGSLAIISGVLQTSQAINAQTGTSYGIATTDAGKLVTFSNAAATAVTLSQATTAGYTAGFSFDVQNLAAGVVTITPATSTINGAATLTLAQNTGCTVTSDGTNYQVSACTALGGGNVFTSGITLSSAANAYTQTSTGLSITSGTTGFGRTITGTVNDASAVDGIIDSATITCTLCTATSYLVDWHVGGTSVFSVTTNGALNTNGGVTTTGSISATINLQGGNVLPQKAVIFQGTTFTVVGTGACATIGVRAGGTNAGSFACTGTTGASTATITPGNAVTTAYMCYGRDVTTPTTVTQTGAQSTTAATLTLTSVTANDVISFACLAY